MNGKRYELKKEIEGTTYIFRFGYAVTVTEMGDSYAKQYVMSDDEQKEIIKAAGKNFSKSAAWRDAWEWAQR